MKGEELRIGNIVNRINFGVYTITGIGADGAVRTDKGVLPIRAIEGIPLTEEWLMKMGCAKIHNNGYIKDNVLFEYDRHAGWGVSYMGQHLRGIEFVHEAQNIYHALIDEELTIKP
jgi:hypothetical protein